MVTVHFKKMLIMMNIFVTFQESLLCLVATFTGVSLAPLGLLASPPRSCDRLDDKPFRLGNEY